MWSYKGNRAEIRKILEVDLVQDFVQTVNGHEC